MDAFKKNLNRLLYTAGLTAVYFLAGKIGLIFGCTGVIDSHYAVIEVTGVRTPP